MMCFSSLLADVSDASCPLPIPKVVSDGFGHPIDSSAVDDPKPEILWAITRACNLRRCHYCDSFIRQIDPSQELSYHQGLTLLDDLATMGISRLILTGGEPLCRPDMPELLGYAVSLGFSCQVQTNGLMLNDSMADRLAGLGLKEIYVAIDGMRQSHDKLRNQAGAFARTTAGIDHAVARGMEVTVRFAIHQLNELELESVFDYCLTHCVRQLIVQHTAQDWSPQSVEAMNHSQTRNWVARLINLTRRSLQAGRTLEVGTLGNQADAAMLLIEMQSQAPASMLRAKAMLETSHLHQQRQMTACIDPIGQISCLRDGQRQPLGNWHQTPFSKLWTDPARKAERMNYPKTRLAARQCRTCPYFTCCGGNCQSIRGRDAGDASEIPATDPWCYLEPDERKMAIPQRSTGQSA